jgi:glutamine synthetase
LRAADIDLFALGVELGPGCLEATLRHKPAMRAADDAAFFRMFTKAFCRQRGLTASFMPLLGAGFPASAACLPLPARPQSGKNVFADRAHPHGLSTTAQSFLAGIIDVVPQAFPMCAHTVNAYRRFAPGSWAPKTVSWAPYNYAAAVRTAAESEEATRLELRLPGGDTNVYLALAMMLGAGLDGLERRLPLKDEPIGAGGPQRDSRQRAAPASGPARGDAPVPRQRDRQAPVRRGLRRAFRDALRGRGMRRCGRAVSAAEVQRYLEGG